MSVHTCDGKGRRQSVVWDAEAVDAKTVISLCARKSGKMCVHDHFHDPREHSCRKSSGTRWIQTDTSDILLQGGLSPLKCC